jgi:L-fuculose-phosphate aldolase
MGSQIDRERKNDEKKVASLDKIVKKMREYGQILFSKNLIDTRSGNVSVKLDKNKLLIKKTGASMPYMTKKDVITLPIYEETEKDKLASSDLKIHRQIYIESEKRNKNINAVLHCHMPEAVAISFFEDEIIPPDYEAQYFIKKIKVSEYDRVPEYVAEFKLCIAKGHGVFVGGKDLDEALFLTLALHNSLKIFLLKTLLEKIKA